MKFGEPIFNSIRGGLWQPIVGPLVFFTLQVQGAYSEAGVLHDIPAVPHDLGWP